MVEKIRFVMGQMWEFLKPFIRILMSRSGPILADAALSAVRAVASGQMSSAEKRSEAFTRIVDTLMEQGIQVGTSVVNLAIEAAVQKLKE